MNGKLSYTILICYTTCADEGLNILEYKFICYVTCGDEVEVVQLRGGTNHIIISYANCADEIKLVQMRSNLCR